MNYIFERDVRNSHTIIHTYISTFIVGYKEKYEKNGSCWKSTTCYLNVYKMREIIIKIYILFWIKMSICLPYAAKTNLFVNLVVLLYISLLFPFLERFFFIWNWRKMVFLDGRMIEMCLEYKKKY